MGKPESGMRYTGAWSYSKLVEFETCKAQFHRKHMLRLEEPGPKSPALIHGDLVHKALESWFKGWYRPNEKKELEAYMGTLLPDFKKLKALKPVTEQMWAHDGKWQPLEDGYRDPKTWVRAKTDAHLVTKEQAHVFDWKSGKPKELYPDQLRFYGVLMMMRAPEVQEVLLELWYVDHGKIVVGGIERSELVNAQKEFRRRTSRLYNEAVWPEEPGMQCRWCPFRKAVGGPCSF